MLASLPSILQGIRGAVTQLTELSLSPVVKRTLIASGLPEAAATALQSAAGAVQPLVQAGEPVGLPAGLSGGGAAGRSSGRRASSNQPTVSPSPCLPRLGLPAADELVQNAVANNTGQVYRDTKEWM